MELKDFIKLTISGIVEATNELQDEFAADGVLINPPVSGTSGVYEPGGQYHTERAIQQIEFDVAVTSSSETGGEAGAGIKIVSFNAGGKGSHSRSSEEVSRVRFSVPMTLRPTSEEQMNREASDKQMARWNSQR